MPSGVANGDNIAAAGFVRKVGEAVDEIDTVLPIGGEHAAALHPDREQHKPAAEEQNRHPKRNPHQRPPGVAPDQNPPGQARRGGFLEFNRSIQAAE